MHTRKTAGPCLKIFATTILFIAIPLVAAEPASVVFSQCSTSQTSDTSHRINVTSVYAQISDYGNGSVVKYDVFGQSQIPIQGATPELLATLFQTSAVLSFTIDESASAFCQSLRAPSGMVPIPDNANCTIPAGPVAFSASTPFKHDFHYTTISTRLRAVDALSPPNELACVDISVTPVLRKGKGGAYGKSETIFWASIGLSMGYWIVVGVGRIAAAWDRGGSGRREGWLRMKWAATVLSSAISGERLSASPALLRFSTPSLRDLIFHTQWCAALAMLAVEWPEFTYPILRNAAWATLIYNVTLIQGDGADSDHWDTTRVLNYTAPPAFTDQISSASSPLYLDASVPNQLLLLPSTAKSGLSTVAYVVGIRPQDLFGTCLAIYLSIVGVVAVISLVVWFADWLLSSIFIGTVANAGAVQNPGRARSPRYSGQSEIFTAGKDRPESPRADETAPLPAPTSRFTVQSRKAWWNYRLGQSSFHRDILYGNLVRILLLFHMPITLYSCYQFTIGRPDATVASLALAALAFIFLSLALPALLLWRIYVTSRTKLYEATRTLLSLGPMYYSYQPGQQKFALLVFAHSLTLGIVIGAGQGSGTAQAIILLIVEVLAALATSMWLPWGEGANMGAMSFLFCVGRIITCVLLVILSPVVNVGNAASGWISYAVLVVNGLIYFAFTLMLLVKIAEGLIRLFAHIPFDTSKNPKDSGIFGVLAMLGCCGSRRKQRSAKHRYRPNSTRRQSVSANAMLVAPTTPVRQDVGPYRMGYLGTSSSVPSYLRPEQASTPYRDDADDPDSGYILGAFHDDETLSQEIPAPLPQNNSGFTRVKGGRAHFDDPFAIQAAPPPQQRRQQRRQQGSGTTPNIVEPASLGLSPGPSSFLPQSYNQIASEQSAQYSLGSAGHSSRVSSDVRLHGRKRSETAIIEDAGAPAGAHYLNRPYEMPLPRSGPPSPSAYRTETPLPLPVIPISNDDASIDSSIKPRRKFWFGGSASRDRDDSDHGHTSDQTDGRNFEQPSRSRWPFRRARNRSEPDVTDATSASATTQLAPPGRSFQVVRPPRQQQANPTEAPSSWSRAATAPDHGDDVSDGHSTQPPSPRAATWSRRQSSPYG